LGRGRLLGGVAREGLPLVLSQRAGVADVIEDVGAGAGADRQAGRAELNDGDRSAGKLQGIEPVKVADADYLFVINRFQVVITGKPDVMKATPRIKACGHISEEKMKPERTFYVRVIAVDRLSGCLAMPRSPSVSTFPPGSVGRELSTVTVKGRMTPGSRARSRAMSVSRTEHGSG
jgi:hypothetical protein